MVLDRASRERRRARRASGLGPRRLAEFATRRPRRVLAAWGLLFLLGVVLNGTLLPSALTSEGDVTNNPESYQAQALIDARLPDQEGVDEIVIVRSEQARVSDAAFRRRVQGLVDAMRRSGSVRESHPGGRGFESP